MADAERDPRWQRAPEEATRPAVLEEEREEEEREEEEAPPTRKKRSWIPLVAGAVALLAVGYFGWRWWQGRAWSSTDDAQVGGDVVPVLARISGYVR
ncbi:MAG TPA: hypothetical protein VF832_11525, partial [Longimicrobiales bacterium]